ncbi:MAG: acyltransferase 3, partial [Acidimicrobiales bacterium]|nr:acyltransferase 3 [Acidimicrobiales bacterium]
MVTTVAEAQPSRTRQAAAGVPRLGYQPALDGLRAVAVGAVMLYHGDVSWGRGGYLGVDAFFVISGFLITTLLVEEWRQHGRIAVGAFWARRVRRLLPALVLVLIAVAAYAAVLAPDVSRRALRGDGLGTLFYVANWRLVLSHQSYFERFAAPSPLLHTWSLAVEEQWYVVWPLVAAALFAFARRRTRRSRAAAVAVTEGPRGLGWWAGGAAAVAVGAVMLYH